jgi:hypothetical protein
MVVMIVVGVAVFAFGIAMVWLFVVRSSRSATITEEDFDDAYDEQVADGEIAEGDREQAWRDFDARQDEEERLSWEEASDE